MKKFKNVFLLAVMAVSAVCVTSCGDDDKDNTPETEENGGNNNGGTTVPGIVLDGNKFKVTLSSGPANTTVDAVKLTAYDANSSDKDKVTVAEGVYKDNVFTLTFGAVPDGCLYPVGEIFALDEKLVSDKTVRSRSFSEVEAYLAGTKVGIFDFNTVYSLERNRLGIIYVDKPVDVEGTADMYTITFPKISLKQGWNVLYYRDNGNGASYTATTSSAGMNFFYNK